MGRYGFVHSHDGYRELMRSQELQGVCSDYAEWIAGAAESKGGWGYGIDVIPGKNRAHARVTTLADDWHSYYSERKHRYLASSIPRKGQRRKK